MNNSDDFYFVLTGFPGLPEKFYSVVGMTIFLVYVTSLCANDIVIGLVILKGHLHQPMYIIIANLAISDLLYDTSTLPKMISKYWSGDGKLSFTACFIQTPIVHTLNCVDSLTITLMAIDRYVAICKPLRYNSIITNPSTIKLCSVTWLVCFAIGMFVASWALPLPYCGPNKVRAFYCSLSKVAILSCADSSQVRRNGFYAGITMHMGPLSFIILSYLIIIANIWMTTRFKNWQKVLNTCITHWFVITLFYIPRIVEYSYNQYELFPHPDLNVLIVCLYTYVPHFCSPIIFCLRTNAIRKTLGKIVQKLING
ncbi:olfactory receptor 6B1-like [Aquarana catesbeiana]|uniref:olfactory receptor 6B1-like n=1 Tax=Aquarana catesbeiana TaxID=8400 RepID=UPI003CCA5DE3